MALTDERIRDLWSWSMTAEAERTANTQQHAFARAIESAACAERDALIAKQRERINWLVTEVATSADVEFEQRARIAELERQLAEARKDAERYRWLRKQHWSENLIGVVVHPRDQTKLGSMLPSLELLDDSIDSMKSNDNAMQKG